MPEEKQDALAVSQPKAEILPAQSAKQTRLAAFTPVNLTEAIALAKMMAQSDVVPKDYKGKAANILVAIQFGSEIGLAPMQSLQSIAVINGRPSLWGDGALALCQGHPDFEDIIETTDGTTATCVIKRKGRSPVKRSFSDDDAAKAGLLTKGGPWTQYRARMRQMRARGFALRDSFADVLKGISIAEEAMDITPDTSPAKQQRDSMTFDIGAITPSGEPNRGHNDTGLERQQKPEQQAPKEKTMCAECRTLDGHSADCSQKGNQEQDDRTSQWVKANYKITNVTHKEAKNGNSYLVLDVLANTGKGKLTVWHQSLFEHLDNPDILGEFLICEVSEKKKGASTYYELEKIIELAGRPFVDNKQAEQGELMPTEREPGQDEDNW